MNTIHAIFYGIFVLIFLYLLVSNKDGVDTILTKGSDALIGETKALQGKG